MPAQYKEFRILSPNDVQPLVYAFCLVTIIAPNLELILTLLLQMTNLGDIFDMPRYSQD